MNRFNKSIINKHKMLLYLGLFISIAYILIFIRPSTIDFDENYTLSIISHNWNQIFHLTSLDVHPPLYYLLLKLFLSVFTFWTSSLLIKILVARLLSIIVSIISWMFLYKIANIMNIKNNIVITWISFILLPTVLGYSFQFQQMTNIRMYALAGLFIIIEFYYLLRFRINQKYSYLIISIISASLATYTHYYSAIIAGLLFLIYFFIYFLNKDIRNSLKIFCSGIFIILFYIPWLNTLFNQMNNPNTYWISNSFLIKQICVYFACIILFLYPIYIYCKKYNNKIFKEQILLILNILILIFIFAMLYGYIKHPIFIFRYMYPLLLLYEFIGINIIINLIKHNLYSKLQLNYYAFAFILLFLNVGISFIYQIPTYNIPSVKAVINYKNWNKNENSKVYINEFNVPNNKKYLIPNFENLLYSRNKNRFFVYNDFMKNNYNPNNNAYKKVFDNIGDKVTVNDSY